MRKSQASSGKRRAMARAGAASARAGAARARGGAAMARATASKAQSRAWRAAARAAPAAGVARSTASRGWYRARIWTAPRLERTGQTLEERVAPKVAAMLSNAARRIDPAPPKRRRWPLVAGGLVLAAGLSGTAAYLMNRRGSAPRPPDGTPEAARPAATPETAEQAAGSDVNGRVRTP